MMSLRTYAYASILRDGLRLPQDEELRRANKRGDDAMRLGTYFYA